MTFALFKGDQKIGKEYPTREQAITEAYERGIVLHSQSDFGRVLVSNMIAHGYSIRELHK